jgi:hypothetical protein
LEPAERGIGGLNQPFAPGARLRRLADLHVVKNRPDGPVVLVVCVRHDVPEDARSDLSHERAVDHGSLRDGTGGSGGVSRGPYGVWASCQFSSGLAFEMIFSTVLTGSPAT